MDRYDKGKPTDTKVTEVTAEPDFSGEDSDPDPELVGTSNTGNGQPVGSTSQKKKKKKKSKAKKMLSSLISNNNIPQAVVDKVIEEVREGGAPGSADINSDDVREALAQMKIMDVVQGKAGIGGINKKAMGEHKVRFSARY